MYSEPHGIDPKRNKEIISAVDDIYNAFIKFYNAVILHGRDLGSKHEENAKNESINKCVARALNVFRGISVLCKTENGTNAMILLRNLYEIKVYIQYLRYSEDSVAERFFDYQDVVWYRYFKKQRGKPFDSKLLGDDQFENLKARKAAFFDKYGGRKDSWSGKSIPDLVAGLPEEIRADEEEDYSTVYAFSSCFVHSNIVSMQKIMSEQGMYKVDGDIDNIGGSYPLAVKAITDIVRIWLEHMEMELPQSILDLERVVIQKMLSNFPASDTEPD